MPLDDNKDPSVIQVGEVVTEGREREVEIVERASRGAIYRHRSKNKVIVSYKEYNIIIDVEVSDMFMEFLERRISERQESNTALEPLLEIYSDFLNDEYKENLKDVYSEDALNRKISHLYASAASHIYHKIPERLLEYYKDLLTKYQRPSKLSKKKLLRDSVIGRGTIIEGRYLEDLNRKKVNEYLSYDVVEYSFRKDLEQALRSYKSGKFSGTHLQHLVPIVEEYLLITDNNKVSREIFEAAMEFLSIVEIASRRDKVILRADSLCYILSIIEHTKERYNLRLMLDKYDNIMSKANEVNELISEIELQIKNTNDEEEISKLNQHKDAAKSKLRGLTAKAKPIAAQYDIISSRYSMLELRMREDITSLRTIFAKLGTVEATRIYPGGKSILDIYVGEFRNCPDAINYNVVNYLTCYGASLTNDLGQGDALIEELFENSLFLSEEKKEKFRVIAKKLKETLITDAETAKLVDSNSSDDSYQESGRREGSDAAKGWGEFTIGSHAFKRYSADSRLTVNSQAHRRYDSKVFCEEGDDGEFETKREDSLPYLSKPTATNRLVEYDKNRDGGDTPVNCSGKQKENKLTKVTSTYQP